MFGFTLFGSTVLIPQMLQSLYGYTATDAGLVLGPGAMVIVVMAPLVVRLVKRIPVAYMIGTGFTVLAFALWSYASFNLETSYGYEALARGIQGFGLAFLFVPISQLAYSYLAKNKNNKASSLTNLSRNQGGSFGIAFVTTMLARRSQFHQTVLVSHTSNTNIGFLASLEATKNYLIAHGYSSSDAATRALARAYAAVQRQAAILSFLDCFWMLGVIALIGPVLAIFIRKFNQRGEAPAH